MIKLDRIGIFFKNGVLLALGSLVYAIGVNDFLIPNRIGEGGVTGLMTLGYYLFHVSPSVTNFVLNLIIMILGWKLLDKKTIGYTFLTILFVSIFLRLPDPLNYRTDQNMIAAVAGGVLIGISLALIFAGGGTIAGSTILAKIMNKYFGMTTGMAMLMFDLAVAIPSVLVIGFQNMLLTMIELYIGAAVLNAFLARYGAKKSIQIISSKASKIVDAFLNKDDGRFMVVQSVGYYQAKKQTVVTIICTSSQLASVIPLILIIDPNAFFVVDDVRSAKGTSVGKLL